MALRAINGLYVMAHCAINGDYGVARHAINGLNWQAGGPPIKTILPPLGVGGTTDG